MISIHMYGRLRRFAPNPSPSANSVVEIEAIEGETLQMLIDRIDIDKSDLYTVFINAKLLTSRTKIASFLGYPQVNEEDCQSWDLNVVIKDGDRLGFFGPDMPCLVI